jgi:hypothetical protein
LVRRLHFEEVALGKVVKPFCEVAVTSTE